MLKTESLPSLGGQVINIMKNRQLHNYMCLALLCSCLSLCADSAVIFCFNTSLILHVLYNVKCKNVKIRSYLTCLETFYSSNQIKMSL